LRNRFDFSPQQRRVESEKKTQKKVKKKRKNEQKAEKLKKKLQNDTFYCVFFVKKVHCFSILTRVLKWAVFCGGKFLFQNEVK